MPILPAAIAAMPFIEKLLLGGVAASFLKQGIMGGLSISGEHKLGKKRIALEEMLAKAQVEAAQAENEENRRATERYLAMLRSSQQREELESSRDRQVQLVMAMLQGLGGFRQQAGATLIQGQRTLPPMALTTLMRGM